MADLRGGAIFAANYTCALELDKVLSFEMGGITAEPRFQQRISWLGRRYRQAQVDCGERHRSPAVDVPPDQ